MGSHSINTRKKFKKLQQHRFTKLEKNCIMIMSGATRQYIEKNYIPNLEKNAKNSNTF